MNTPADWAHLIVEPKAILGAYGSRPPALSTFVIHALNAESDRVRIAGEFTELPAVVPSGWTWNGRSIACVIFDLVDVKSSSISGAVRWGASLPLSLEETPELWATAPNGRKIYYKRLRGSAAGIDVEVMAAHVRVVVGRAAMKGDDWYKLTSNPRVESDALARLTRTR